MRSFSNALLAASFLLGTGCSIRGRALRAVADTASMTDGGAFARDDDPELVADAVPFALKTMESLADSEHLQDHVGLRLGLARGFTQYGYAFVQQPAELGGAHSLAAMQATLLRARKLYLRARGYGLDGLRIARGVSEGQLRASDKAALAKLQKEDAALVYWTIAPWAAAIAANKRDLEMVGDVPAIAGLLDRARELDEGLEQGALHEFAITFDPARPEGTTPARQKAHFERALQLAEGKKISPYVTYAQAALTDDKKAYVAVLKQAASFDVDKPEARDNRLANVLAQRRAVYLLAHLDDVFSD